MSKYNNLVIGFTGAFGSGCSFIADEFLVKKRGFTKFSLSDALRKRYKEKYGRMPENRHDLQEFGNETRKEFGNDVLARDIFERIHGADYDKDKQIVIDSIRNPGEISFFRNAYPNFFLFGIFADYNTRWDRVKATYNNSMDDFIIDEQKDKGSHEPENGQQISKCFFEADLILANNANINCANPNKEYMNMDSAIEHYLLAFKEPKLRQPTIIESFMAMAYANGRLSKCDKRRVGALIVDENNNVLSTGFNNVPLGLTDCKGEYGECYRDIKRREKTEEINKVVSNLDFSKDIISRIKMLDLCRSLHAEENAILNLIKNSCRNDYSGCTLYVTTYPCNLCANKIVQIGIRKIVYYEPYPVLEAKEIFDKAGIKTEPFTGVTFRSFFRAYTFEG